MKTRYVACIDFDNNIWQLCRTTDNTVEEWIRGKWEPSKVNRARFDDMDWWDIEDLGTSLEDAQRRMDAVWAERDKKNKPSSVTFGEAIKKYNEFHDERGRFASKNGSGTGAMTPGTRMYAETSKSDMKWAKETIERRKAKGLAGGSLEGHIDENGNLTPEREKLHKEIIDKILEGKTPVEDGQPTMTMLGGGPSSGKSSVMSTDTSNDPHSIVVNSDEIKSLLPGHDEMAKKTADAADFYHAESSLLATRLYKTAASEGVNIIYDGTGDGSVEEVENKIAIAKSNGMKATAKYVSVETPEAWDRNVERYNNAKAKFEKGEGDAPRWIPEEYFADCHGRVTDISVQTAPKFDSIEIWDNNGAKGTQHIIAKGGSGKPLKIISGRESDVNSFLNKSKTKGFTINNDGEISKNAK